MLWPSVRRQLQRLAADLVRYRVVRTLQVAVLLQDFLLKLNIRLPFCRASLLQTSMATNCAPLLENDEKAVAAFHRHQQFAFAEVQRLKEAAPIYC